MSNNTYPNSLFLGRCVDLVSYDPVRVGPDSFKLDVAAFSLQSDDGAVYTSYNDTIGDGRATSFASSYDYQRTFSASFTASGQDALGMNAFSASASYQSYFRKAGTENSFILHVQQTYADYALAMRPFEDAPGGEIPGLPMDAGYKRALLDLVALAKKDGATKDEIDAALAKFVRGYGTHFAAQVTLGGQFSLDIVLSHETYESQKAQDVKLEEMAKLTYNGMTGKAESTQEEKLWTAFASAIGTQHIFWTASGSSGSSERRGERGLPGGPSDYPAVAASYDQWSKRTTDPTPISVRLKLHAEVLRAPLLDSEPREARDKAAAWLDEYFTKYMGEPAQKPGEPPAIVRPAIILYDDANFGAGGEDCAQIYFASKAKLEDTSDGSRDMDQKVSSVFVIHGAWQICQYEDYRGKTTTLAPGRYAHSGAFGGIKNDAISSIKYMNAPPEPNVAGRIVFFRRTNLREEPHPFTAPEIGTEITNAQHQGKWDVQAFGDQMASMMVHLGTWRLDFADESHKIVSQNGGPKGDGVYPDPESWDAAARSFAAPVRITLVSAHPVEG